LPLPVICIGLEITVEILVSAEEINQRKTLQQLKELVQSKIE